MDSVAIELYSGMAAQTEDDPHRHAEYLLEAIGHMFQEVDDLARDTDEGPGWSALLDPDRVPAKGLDFLAQFVGVSFPLAISDDEARERIKNMDGTKRGRPASIKAAPVPYLSGTKTVILKERDDGPYHQTVYTYIDETEDEASARLALAQQKPGGIIQDYIVTDRVSYDSLAAEHTDYDDVEADFTDYDDIAT